MPLHVLKDQTGWHLAYRSPESYTEDGTGREEAGLSGCSSSEDGEEGVSLVITGPAHLWALHPWEYILAKTFNPFSVSPYHRSSLE